MNNVLKEFIHINQNFLIYGAHLVALECYRCFASIGKKELFVGFAVSELADNPKEIAGYPVRSIEDYASELDAKACTVVIAMPEKYHREVIATASEQGFQYFIPVGQEALSEVKADWLLTIANMVLPSFQ